MSLHLPKIRDTYYYRIKIPLDLQDQIPFLELKKSLRTNDIHAAKVLSSSLNQRVAMAFALLRSKNLSEEQTEKLIIDLFPRKRSKKILKLSEVIGLYSSERSAHWGKKTQQDTKYITSILLLILGDKNVKDYTRADCLQCREKLTRLPNTLHSAAKFKDMTIDEIAAINWPKPLSPKTVNRYVGFLSSALKWATIQRLIPFNVAEALAFPIVEKPEHLRKEYSLEDLCKISKLLLPYKQCTPEKFWVPFITMYSGMRLDEICQLHLSDITKIDDVWCIDINDAGEKKLKTLSSKRVIPVHPKLIELGLLAYNENRKQAGAKTLWEGAAPNKHGFWGTKIGNWYAGINRRHITSDPKKCLHSFRHLFANTLKQIGVEGVVISELLGHRVKSISLGRYGKSFKPNVLLEAMRKIDYGDL